MASLNISVAAIEKSQQRFEKKQVLKLSQSDTVMLLEALDAPPKVHAGLQQAARRYEAKSQS